MSSDSGNKGLRIYGILAVPGEPNPRAAGRLVLYFGYFFNEEDALEWADKLPNTTPIAVSDFGWKGLKGLFRGASYNLLRKVETNVEAVVETTLVETKVLTSTFLTKEDLT